MATTSENSIDNFLWSDSSILSSSGLLFFGHLLKTLKQNCKRELYNEVIPFWIEHGVDADLGGFICGLHHDGTVDNDSKFSWYQGRGAWVFAQLYEKTREPAFLTIAKQAIDFVRRYCFMSSRPDSFTLSTVHQVSQSSSAKSDIESWAMWTVVARDGKTIPGHSKHDTVGYSMLFYAEGLQAVARYEQDPATKVAMLKECVGALQAFLRSANDPERNAPEDSYLLHKPYKFGTRTLGHSMIPLRICTQLLRDHKIFTNSQINPSPNESISRKDNNSVNLPTTSVSANHLSPQDRAVLCTIANECVRNIMQRHLDVQWMLLREEVNNDWTHLDNGGLHPDSDPTNSDSTASSPVLFYLGHAVEALWFVMDEAARTTDQKLLERAAKLLRRHANVAWDELCGGMVRGITVENNHNDKFLKDKVAWVQQEGLVGSLMVAARSQDKQMVDWATTFFTKLYKWTMNRFPLANHIKLKSSSNRTKCPLWLVGGDRNASFLKEYSFGNAGLRTRKENYHHPRFLLMGADLATEILVKRTKFDNYNSSTDNVSQAEIAETASGIANVLSLGSTMLPRALPHILANTNNSPGGAAADLQAAGPLTSQDATLLLPKNSDSVSPVTLKGRNIKLECDEMLELFDALNNHNPYSCMMKLGVQPVDHPYAQEESGLIDLAAEKYLEKPEQAVSVLDVAEQMNLLSLQALKRWAK